MTNEERIANLEKIVREFNLAVAGANIQGGFPEMPTLPPSASLEQKLERLENAHKEFSIRGGVNANVEGSLQHGFTVNLKCPETSQGTSTLPQIPPPVIGCPSCPGSGTITVRISDIIVCGCVSYVSLGFGSSVSITDNGTINGVFVIPWSFDPDDDSCGTNFGNTNAYHRQAWDDTTCTGNMIDDSNRDPVIQVTRYSDGSSPLWRIHYHDGVDTLFWAESDSDPINCVFDNTYPCGTSFFSDTFIMVSSGGRITLSA